MVALQGLLANSHDGNGFRIDDYVLAKQAYRLAGAMMEEKKFGVRS